MAFPNYDSCFHCDISFNHKNCTASRAVQSKAQANIPAVIDCCRFGNVIWKVWCNLRFAMVDLLPGTNANDGSPPATIFKLKKETYDHIFDFKLSLRTIHSYCFFFLSRLDRIHAFLGNTIYRWLVGHFFYFVYKYFSSPLFFNPNHD